MGTPEFVAIWSEMLVAGEPSKVQLASEVRRVLLGSMLFFFFN